MTGVSHPALACPPWHSGVRPGDAGRPGRSAGGRRPGAAAVRDHVRGGRPGDHRRRARRRRDHRDRRGQGARRRGAGRARHPGQPGRADPAVHHRADRHHPGHAAARPRRSSRCCRASWSSSRDAVLVAHNAPYDVGFLKAACAKHGYRWPNPRVLDTAALARRVLTARRGAQPQAGHPGRLLPHRHPAHPPGAGRRPGHRGRAARADRPAGRPPGATRVGEAIEFARAVTPTQRRKRHLADGLPDGARGLHLPGRRRPAALRRHLRRHRHPGAQLLHRRREAGPDLRDAGRRRAGGGGRVRPLAGGGGPRAAADRRARAAVQPPVEVSGADGAGSS